MTHPVSAVNKARNAFFEGRGLAESLVFIIGESAKPDHKVYLTEVIKLATPHSGYGLIVGDRQRSDIVGIALSEEGRKWITLHVREGRDPKSSHAKVDFTLTEEGEAHFKVASQELAQYLQAHVNEYQDDMPPPFMANNALATQVGSMILEHISDPDVMALLKKFNINAQRAGGPPQ